jgi:protein SCO1/2
VRRPLQFAALLCLIAGALAGVWTADLTRPKPALARFVPPAEPAFDFRLRDQDGRAASLAQARGKVVVLTFMYSTCHDLCPAQASDPRVFRFLLGTRAQLRPVWRAYGIVPVGATPQEAAAAAAATERFLHSPAAAHRGHRPYSPPKRPAPPAAATEQYPDTGDLRYRGLPRHSAGVDFEHSAYVMLLDERGIQRVGIPFEQLTPDSLAHDLRLLRDER